MTKGIFQSILLMLCAIAATEARAEYISGTSVNCRTQLSLRATIVHRFRAGEPVSVLVRDGDWTSIRPPGKGCWVEADLVVAYSPAPPRYASHPAGRPEAAGFHLKLGYPSRRAAASRSARHRYSHRSRGFSGNGSCPCSGGSVCIGPRGGRYCITSGGNKRYGV